MNFARNIIFFLFLVFLFSCARLGSPEGGPRDEVPPRVLFSSPDSLQTNVSTDLKELRIDFDEYVKLDKPMQQLIISPPIQKIKKIIPSNLANKYILIQWEDTLKANTTYNFNFGNSISDNNEGNILPYYNLVFSTGDYVDSLYITGYVDDVLEPRTENDRNSVTSNKDKPVVVGLYHASSSDYHEKPYYIAVADQDGYFELNYLEEGEYSMVAFQDENLNNIYDSGKEKVAFITDPIHITKDSTGIRLLLSQPKKHFKLQETQQIAGGLLMLFEGRPNDSLNLKSISEDLKSYAITRKPTSDSAYVWINPEENGFDATSKRLQFSFYDSVKKKVDTTNVYYRLNPNDAFSISNSSGNVIPPEGSLVLRANMELKDIDTSKWELKKDSITSVPLQAEISPTDAFQVIVKSDGFSEGEKLSLMVPKESVKSYFYTNEKSILFNFQVGKAQDYGALVVHLENAPTDPYWMQLLNQNYDVMIQQRVENTADVEFKNLKPETYLVRVLVDNNRNGEWDGADFENRIQPEDAYLWRKKIVVRPSWIIDETWDILDKTPINEDEENDSFIPTGQEIKKIDLNSDKKNNGSETQPNSNDIFNNQNINSPLNSDPLRRDTRQLPNR